MRSQSSLHDIYDLRSGSAPGSTPSVSYSPPPPHTSITTEPVPLLIPATTHDRFVSDDHDSSATASTAPSDENPSAGASPLDKGKAKEIPPTLPPLLFSPSDLGYGTIDWPSPEQASPIPGPSSYGSGHTSLLSADLSPSQTSRSGSLQTPLETVPQRTNTEDAPALIRIPSRRRSLSNLSIHSTRSMSRIKAKLGSSKNPGNLARRLLFRNKTDIAGPSLTPSSSVSLVEPDFGDLVAVGQGSCLLPWKATKADVLSPPTYPNIDADGKLGVESATLPFPHDSITSNEIITLKGKGRSYSSPFPASVFDIVPAAPNNIFVPLPLEVRNLFDEVLPRELRLQVLSALVSLHQAEHERKQKTGQWTVASASSSKNRWVGKDRGMRELVKLSRVSKAWQGLVFDGQLWMDVNLRAFPKLPTPFLLRLAETLGPFIRNVDLTGHIGLTSATLVNVTNSLCIRPIQETGSLYTQLTDINLQGCSSLSTQSLHNLLVHSPYLRTLCVKGLRSVTNATFDVLAQCPRLTSLNLSRCVGIDGEGVRAFAAASLARGDFLALKELRVSGLKGINDEVLATLGRAAPSLEVLDLSYCRSLHNSALEAFVACTEADKDIEIVLLTARQAGRDSREMGRFPRRVTALRHLVLSNCILLTDIACSNLAHAVPRLEFLELAGIGTEIKDDGLVRLLETTPLLKKLDLEDASDISDAVLAALTPSTRDAAPSQQGATSDEPPQTGHALEHLVVSYAISVSNDAFLALIRNCPRLRVLEADSTCVSGSVLREFVRLVRTRNIPDATFVAIDCRAIGESVVKEVSTSTRPRKGWRSWDARKLAYLDERDREELKVGQDECDEKRVVLKSFYNWQTVDAVRAARERRRKASRRVGNSSTDTASEAEDSGQVSGRARWWSPSGRRSSGNNTPDTDREGCIVM
ncbi:RNI-like protein [Leucogyrophana mollusca]|uniref:RNI-like protein n=1 Tax=Leucogyrophana mollusca TaxID=85980 RepID=A0ACB8BD93_9AGAM|nr:RNI-like protein [Leucogyrophana mollusca]